MASSTYLSNPVLTINSVDLTDMCSAATLTYLVEALEDTAFGTNSRSYTAGLVNNEDLDDVCVVCSDRNLRNLVSVGWH